MNAVRWTILYAVSLCSVCSAAGCGSGERADLSRLDPEAVARADRSYAEAWFANDPARVMQTLTDKPVIVPSGMQAIVGRDAIREFWWPADAPGTTVTEFTIVQREIGGDGDFAFVRGSFTLSFEYANSIYSNAGDYISILRRSTDGSWKISQRMWNDHGN